MGGAEIAIAKATCNIRLEFIKAAMQGLCASECDYRIFGEQILDAIAMNAIAIAGATLAKARETQP